MKGKVNKMKYHRYVTLALILAIPVSMPRIIIAIVNKEPVYLIIDKITFLFWFIGMWVFFHKKYVLGLVIMVSTCSIFFVWAILFFKVASIDVFTILPQFFLVWFTIDSCFKIWLEQKKLRKDQSLPANKKRKRISKENKYEKESQKI